MCSPGTASVTRASAPGVTSRNDARPSGPSETSSRAHVDVGSRAEGDDPAGAPVAERDHDGVVRVQDRHARRDRVRRSAPRTPRRSTPTIRRPPCARRRRSSPRRRRAARSPDRSFTSPRRRAPISATSTSVSGGAPSSVSGSPISLLNDPGLAWTRNRVFATAWRQVLRGGLAVRARDPHDGRGHRPSLVRGEPHQRLRRRVHPHDGPVHVGEPRRPSRPPRLPRTPARRSDDRPCDRPGAR